MLPSILCWFATAHRCSNQTRAPRSPRVGVSGRSERQSALRRAPSHRKDLQEKVPEEYAADETGKMTPPREGQGYQSAEITEHSSGEEEGCQRQKQCKCHHPATREWDYSIDLRCRTRTSGAVKPLG